MTHLSRSIRRPAGLLAGMALSLAGAGAVLGAPAETAKKMAGRPTAEEARQFVEEAGRRLMDLNIRAGRAQWVQSNFITLDTEILAAEANEALTAASVELAKQASRFDDVEVPADVHRQLELLKQSLDLPAPSDPEENAEVARLSASLQSQYGAGKYCPQGAQGDDCLDLEELSEIIETSRDPKELLEAWTGWHAIAPPMREDYRRLVELANEGARELGYKDVGALWRAKYDMPSEAFAADVDRLWNQVKPLYDALHCHVRAKLNEKYGDKVVPPGGPIPAHLLGNMWAQGWSNLYDLVAPPQSDPGYDVTEALKARNTSPQDMVRYGERFFTSLGFEPLPATFWERSLFTKPRDREVVCHASAWSMDYEDDLRIKMCIRPTDEDFVTIHHELGHNFYQRAYNELPYLYQTGANDGFHEAVGDTIALSITPEYLKQVGLIERVPDPSKDLGLLMKEALERIAFLPFGLLIDQWRWQVFSGEISPEEYNQTWWELRQKYQGVQAPVARTEKDFDPGAKYHIPANTPYMRYFLAGILMFDFHRGLCQAAGYQGPLHRCSIYGNQVAGERLEKMLAMGASRPWPEALAVVTGKRQTDASAIVAYFAPVKAWLDQQNQGRKCGW